MIEKYYTRDQPADLQTRELGAGAIEQTESDWSQLIAMVELGRRWQELIGDFTGEDAHPDGSGADDPWSASRCDNDSERKQIQGSDGP